MPVVTLTGRVGVPARPLGLEVAHILGADYIDHQILAEAARRSGAPLEAVAQKDERAMRIKERLGRFFQNFLEKSAAAGSAGDPFLGPTGVEVLLSRDFPEAAQPATTQAQMLGDKRYIELITSIVQDLAKSGNVVLIGRGSHVILRDLPNALHVYVVANDATRVAEVQRREGMSPAAAARYIRETDPARIAYYKKFFKVDAQDPALFHLFLNIDRIGGVERAARIVAQTAREMERQPARV